MPEVSPSVLIIRLDGIGDALALTPLLAALRRHAVPVDIVLRQENAGIFSSRALRGETIARFALRSNAKPNLAAIERLGGQLRERAYTHVLVATEDPSGYRLARAVGAPVRTGFADPWGKPLKALWTRGVLTDSLYRSAGLDRRGPHECEVLFTLGSSLIGTEQPTRNLDELRPLVLEREPEPNERVAVQITTKYERLGIPLAEVVELIRRLVSTAELDLLSSRREGAYAQRIADATGLPVRYFDALEPWKSAIGAAAAILTPDSGALHVAGMTGTPVVAIFPPDRDFALQVARWAPWAAPYRVVPADSGWPQRANEALAHLR